MQAIKVKEVSIVFRRIASTALPGRRGRGGHQHTTEMEIVASANGSPRMFPKLTERIPEGLRPFRSIWPFILWSDGECSEPYVGIRKMGASTFARVGRGLEVEGG